MPTRSPGLAAALLLAATAAVTPPAEAREVAKGLTCGLATAAGDRGVSPPRHSGVLTGGPVAVVEEIALLVGYQCTVQVFTSTGALRDSVRASFETSGPVGLLPPTPVSFRADPAGDRVQVCTTIDWYFGFPGGGSVDGGCRTAPYGKVSGAGYLLPPAVLR